MSGSNALTIARDPTVQVNPLAAMNAGTQAAGNVLDVQAKQGERLVGQALQQATDEQGNVDIGKARSLAASMGPNAAFAMQGFLKTASTLRGQGIEQNLKINDAVNGAVTAALASDDSNLKQAVIEQAGRLRGILPADQVDHALLHLSSDPAQLRQQLETLRVQSLPPQQRQDWIYGKPITVDQGTGVQGAVQSQRGGAIGTSGGAVPVYAPPGTQGQPVHWTTSDGITHDGTWAQYNVDRGNGRVVGQVSFGGAPAVGGTGSAGGGTSGAPGTQVQPGVPNAANPPRLNPAQPPAGTGQPAAPPAPKLTDTTQPAPGMQEKWKASSDQYNADNAAAGSYQQRIFPLVQGRALLESGDVTTGRGAETVQQIKGLLGTVAGQFGWDINTINNAKFEELNKYLTQYTNSLPMAGASDARLASALTGNPSAHISTMANKDVVKALIGLERMKQTAITEFAAQGGQPAQYSDYLRDWQNKHDPRAFIADMLDDGQIKKMLAGMTKTQKDAFTSTLAAVERNPGVMGQAAMPGH